MFENSDWKVLYRVGGIAALLAAILFRRNIGAEVSLFTGVDAIPITMDDWYTLLQNNPFVGLSFLAVFDIFNYFLEGLIFLALSVALWQTHKSVATMALASGVTGIVLSFASNISLTMFSLSQRYSATASGAQKIALLAAGQTILAINDPLSADPGTGAYLSLLLIALAGLLLSGLLLPSNRATAIVGLLASSCDLAYCLTFAFAPFLQAVWLASGGLFWMIWHLLIARVLLQRAKK